MKLFQKKSLKTHILVALFLVFSLLFSISGGLLSGISTVHAAYFTNPLTNPYFTQSYSSQFTSTLNGWTTINYTGYQEAKDRDNYKSGAAQASSVTASKKESDEKLWKNFGLIEDPGKADYFSGHEKFDTYLMMSSPRNEGRIGYQSTSDLTLDANSFYKITVTFKTTNGATAFVEDIDEHGQEHTVEVKSDAFASIYLTGLTSDAFVDTAMFERVNTQNQWTTRSFYIATTPFYGEKLRIELWLGGNKVIDSCQGAAFFNDVDVERFTEESFLYELEHPTASKNLYKVIDLDTFPYITDQLANPSFEDGLNSWTQLDNNQGNTSEGDLMDVVNFNSSFPITHGDVTIKNPGSNQSINVNQNALLINLQSNGYLGVRSTPIDIKANGYYKLSVFSVSDCNTGEGGNVRLVQLDKNGKPKTNGVTSLTTATTIADHHTRNGWTQYSFYIHGNSLDDMQVALELSLGNEEELTTGYVFFDDITFQKISYDIYSQISTSSQTELVSLQTAKSKIFMIENESFNHVDQSGIDTISYPALPKDWELDVKSQNASNNYLAGVLNTSPTHFDKYKNTYSNYYLTNPDAINSETNNNVLVMSCNSIVPNSNNNDHITYTSALFELDSHSTYHLSFYYNYMHIAQAKNSTVNIKVFNSEHTIVQQELSSTDGWEQLAFTINTSFTSGSYQIQLTFSNTKGHIFFDDFFLTSTPHVTEINTKNTKIDLSKNNFQDFNNWNKTSSEEDIFANVTGNEAERETLEHYGIYDLTHTNDGNESALYIFNRVDAHTTLESTNSYTLQAQNYYKLSIWIRTSQLSPSLDLDSYGARFAIGYGDKLHEFKGIVTDEYLEYSVYINPNSNIDTKILLGLGDKETNLYGIAFFDNFQITTFDSESEYENDHQNMHHERTLIIESDIEAEDDGEIDIDDDHDHDHSNPANIWMAVSGMITGLAVIIALLGTATRRIRWKRTTKVANTYDRRKTLNKSLDRREQIQLREDLIEEIKSELDVSTKEFDLHSKDLNEKILELKELAQKESMQAREQIAELETEKDKEDRLLNAKLAEDKINTSIKEDKLHEKQISKILAKQKSLQKTVDKIEAKYEKHILKLELTLEKLASKPLYLQQEIKELQQEINEISEQEKQEAMKAKK